MAEQTTEPVGEGQTVTQARVLTALAERLGAFRDVAANRSLRLLLVGLGGSSLGQWAAGIAITVLSYERGGSQAVALQLVIRLVPAAVAAPLLATLADRGSRIRVMVVCDIGRALLFAGMAALVAIDAPLILVYVGSGLAAVLATGVDPAKSAVLPGLVESPAQLTAANVVLSTVESVAMFAGPALAGVLLAATSTQAVVAVTAGTLTWSALMVSRIDEPERAPPAAEDAGAGGMGAEPESFLAATLTGVQTVVREPGVRSIVGLLTTQTLVCGLSIALITGIALDVLKTGEGGVGALNAAIGVGGVVGAGAAMALVGERRLVPGFVAGCLLWGLPFVLMGALPSGATCLFALGLVGLGNTVVDVAGLTLLQRSAPEAVLARVFGVLESLILGSIALGALLAPALIGLASIRGALVITGAILPVALLAAARSLRRLELTGTPVPATLHAITLLGGDPIFAPLPVPVRERLAAVLQRKTVEEGEVIFAQGEPGDHYYLIVDGAVEVSVDGRRVREERSGEGFGEIALLRDLPRTATVRAVCRTELVALSREEFLTAVGADPGSAHAAADLARGRLAWARPLPTPA